MPKTYIFATLLFLPSVVFADCGSEYPSEPTGTFVVAALRMSSDVASSPLGDDYNHLFGKRVSFDEPRVWLDGQPFDGTRYIMTDVAIVNYQDPNLSDIMVLPPEAEGSKNCWLLDGAQIIRDGKSIQTIFLVDRRVMMVPMANSALNVVLEKPLETEEVTKLQMALMRADFLNGDVFFGDMGPSTIEAIASYAEHLGAEYKFADPVISENMLAGLGLLNVEY